MNNQNTIFDMIVDEPKGQEGYFKIAEEIPMPEDETWLDTASDFGKTILKGTLEGVQRFGRMMGPIPTHEPEEKIQEEFTEQLEELIPQKSEEGFVQKSLRRGLRQAPTIMAFPGSTIGTLPRAIAAGFTGEGAKKLGAPEWVQAAAEITAFIGPDITKKLLEKGSNKEIIEAAKNFGLNDNQIAPLIQSEFKQKWLSKLANVGARTKKSLSESKEALGEAYNVLKKSPVASLEVSPEIQSELFKKFTQIAEEMPSSVREKVAQDFLDLTNKPVTGDSLMNLYKDINKALGPNTKELSLFKAPISEAITKYSPDLGKDFNNLNNLYSRYSNIASKLKPTLATSLVRAAESLGLLGGAIMGDTKTVGVILAEKGVKILASELLINPRLSQLSEKFLLALNQHKWGLAAKISKQWNAKAEDLDKDLKLDELTEEDIKELFVG